MTDSRVTVDRDGQLLLIGLNRPEKRNAADWRMLQELSLAYGELERDPGIRCGLVYAHGDHFTGGLDLADVAPRIGPRGLDIVAEGGLDPWQLSGPARTKPVVIAVQGTCLTLGIELVLASDVAVAARSTSFAQIEVGRGILPFGGATIRFPRTAGWGNAMRWILTGDAFDAAEAHRMGLVQEVTDDGAQFDRALAIARRIAAQAPLAVQATLANARLAAAGGDAAGALQPELVRLVQSEDSRIGMRAFLDRTTAEFLGR
ncbi:crotonase/enoyl-CoA hydratase family protein [Galbitalea soli]|uniref:Crotonase/enoyl-CoA hydratase family protein n=1 Tax=Galbitalea soli TaxID=1268042 RepID=A0A7C9PM54_9MICO|nr:crotonase/enoyl-CoA hydratase family protein [Galbitalea soli]NEM90488.1 crotonase/enoyl-CoA hydratase family protein [Galbitalea soli]NYJ31201.1 enoyl-CoA hydratase/carnithine racemase [Galbitalea soli]